MNTASIEITVSGWDELKNMFSEMCLNGWYFRGQANKDWALSTTLERTNMVLKEQMLIRDFKRNAYQYLNEHTIPNSTIEWIALMQHHGAPTRLLDWTRSPYVASFFAMNDKYDDAFSVLWAVNFQYLTGMTGNRFKDDNKYAVLKDSDYVKTHIMGEDDFLKIFMSQKYDENNLTPPMVLPVAPFVMNERLNIQQGTFLCQTRLYDSSKLLSFEDNLFATFDGKLDTSYIIKILIPADLRQEIIIDLNYMNINDATLFTNLDGFARSLQKRLSVF